MNEALAGLDRDGLLEPSTPGTVLRHPLVRGDQRGIPGRRRGTSRSGGSGSRTAWSRSWQVRRTARRGGHGGTTRGAHPPVPHGWDPRVRPPARPRPGTAQREMSPTSRQRTPAGAYVLELELRQRILDIEAERLGASASRRTEQPCRRLLGLFFIRSGKPAQARASRFGTPMDDALAHHPDRWYLIRNSLESRCEMQEKPMRQLKHLEAVLEAVQASPEGPDDSQTLQVTSRPRHCACRSAETGTRAENRPRPILQSTQYDARRRPHRTTLCQPEFARDRPHRNRRAQRSGRTDCAGLPADPNACSVQTTQTQ